MRRPTAISDPHLRELLFAYGRRISELENRVDVQPQETPRMQQEAPRFDHRITEPISISSALTLEGGALNRVVVFNCTTATTVDLPPPAAGSWITVLNVGTANLTVRNNSSVNICVLTTDDMVHLRPWLSSAGAAEWPSFAHVVGQDGSMMIADTSATKNSAALLHLESTTQGLLLPRMTTTQRNSLASVPVGLCIFNTTTDQPEVYVDNGGSPRWESFGGVASP